jgi:hypothetical protein
MYETIELGIQILIGIQVFKFVMSILPSDLI